MKRFSFLLFLLIGLFIPLFSEELIVRLETQRDQAPLWIEPIENRGSEFASSYISQIEGVLRRDIARSGYAYLSDKSERVKGKVTLIAYKEGLKVTLHDVGKQANRSFPEIVLTGSLNIDRQTIHRLADQAIDFFFGTPGIASRKILFATQFPAPRHGHDYLSEIWQCDYDGSNLEPVTQEGHYAITPVYFPSRGESDRFCFVCYKNGPPKIYISSLSDKKSEPLIALRGNQLLPSFSRDGRKLAFVSDATGRADLFLQLIDPVKGPIGKPMQLFSAPESVQASSSFSPDGDQIVFVSDKDGSPRLYLIDLKNLQSRSRPAVRCLTMVNRENTGPTWAPDGKKIAYSAKTNGIRQIWVYDLETREERQLTFDGHHKENPCFAQNSLHLVYNTTDPRDSELYVINLNDPTPIRITSGPGKKHYPAWEP